MVEINANNVYIKYGKGEGISSQKIRTSTAVTSAKKNVRLRDVRCQCCGEADKIIEVHHILPVAKYPELVSDERNMICLCQSCHSKYHQVFENMEGADTFAKFIRDNGGLS